MNFSKILNWIFGIMAFIGVFLMIGTVGASDYAVEMGICEPLTAHLKEYIIGAILIIPGIIYLKMCIRDRKQSVLRILLLRQNAGSPGRL